MSIFKKGFNPILFLDLPEPKNAAQKNQLWFELQTAMTEYTCIRLLKLLPEEKHLAISSISELLKLAQKDIPDFDKTIHHILHDFKVKFKQQYE